MSGKEFVSDVQGRDGTQYYASFDPRLTKKEMVDRYD